MINKILFLFLILTNTCYAQQFIDCSVEQQEIITKAFDHSRRMVDYAIHIKNDKLFVKWFGNNNQLQIKSNFMRIQNAMYSKNVVFDCFSNMNVYAYVSPQMFYHVYLANKFWNAEMDGYNSMAGTIVHEFSHFTDTVESHDTHIMYSEGLSIAKGMPQLAAINANNYEFYAEELYRKNFIFKK